MSTLKDTENNTYHTHIPLLLILSTTGSVIDILLIHHPLRLVIEEITRMDIIRKQQQSTLRCYISNVTPRNNNSSPQSNNDLPQITIHQFKYDVM